MYINKGQALDFCTITALFYCVTDERFVKSFVGGKQYLTPLLWSQDSIYGTAIRLQAGQSWVQIPAG